MSNLFPPIVDSRMPAFLQNTTCKIYFSLSSYNAPSEIANCQVRITYQNNNMSALKTSLYPSEIKICNLLTDNTVTGDNKYYIEIRPNDLQHGVFDIDYFYKVQIRFTSTEASAAPSSSSGIDAWLANNISYFSEWSEICLIKAISIPSIDFQSTESYVTRINSLVNNYLSVRIVGQVKFANENDTQHIKSYKVLIYKNGISASNLVSESKDYYINKYNNINEINYKTNFPIQNENVSYTFNFIITTNNLYTFSSNYIVSLSKTQVQTTGFKIETILDEENGRIGVSIEKNTTDFSGNIVIIRASNKDGFKYWEDVHTGNITLSDSKKYIWYDNTIESGIFYLYGVQEVNNQQRLKAVTTENPSLVIFQNMYLSTKEQQLNIKFDPQVSSFSYTISENMNETIGSKYPFFRRNGYVNYRTIPISGTISFFTDADALMKASRQDVFGEYKEWYDAYNTEKNISPYNDYIYEKFFRDKLIEFLYNDDIKLFRSGTQGNILVKIMNVSLTPNQTLSRRIYSFSCVLYEIDDFNLQNCQKYETFDLSKGGSVVTI